MLNNSRLCLIKRFQVLIEFYLSSINSSKPDVTFLPSVDDYLLIGDKITVHVERATLIKLRLQFLLPRRSVSLENPLSASFSLIFVRRFIGVGKLGYSRGWQKVDWSSANLVSIAFTTPEAKISMKNLFE